MPILAVFGGLGLVIAAGTILFPRLTAALAQSDAPATDSSMSSASSSNPQFSEAGSADRSTAVSAAAVENDIPDSALQQRSIVGRWKFDLQKTLAMVSDPARRKFLHTMAEFSNSEWQFTASGEFSAQLKLLSDGQSVDQVGRWRQLSPTEFIGSTSLVS